MKKLVFVALLLIGATILGATVLREPIASAAQNVGATIVGPLDDRGNVAVHEQGTARVNVTNSTVPVAPQTATKNRFGFVSVADAQTHTNDFGTTINASTIMITNVHGNLLIHFLQDNGAVALQWFLEDGHDIILPLPQPLPVDGLDYSCASSGSCEFSFNVIGT